MGFSRSYRFAQAVDRQWLFAIRDYYEEETQISFVRKRPLSSINSCELSEYIVKKGVSQVFLYISESAGLTPYIHNVM